jgi:hypothetical protein
MVKCPVCGRRLRFENETPTQWDGDNGKFTLLKFYTCKYCVNHCVFKLIQKRVKKGYNARSNQM